MNQISGLLANKYWSKRQPLRAGGYLAGLMILLVSSFSIAGDRSLFETDELLAASLRGQISTMNRDRDPAQTYTGGTLSYVDDNGTAVALDINLQARGRKRLNRATCRFVPIRVRFDKKQISETIFAHYKKMKLVTQCQPNTKKYENYLVNEYLSYKILNILTDYSYRVRLANISYVDGDNKPLHSNLAFFIEPSKQLAKRIRKEKLNITETTAVSLNKEHLNLVSLFQFMLGNTDWSATHGGKDECCHNGKLFADKDTLADYLYIPYDFDMTGLVNPEYATFDKALKIKSIRERRYRGYCRNNDKLAMNIAIFNSKKQSIMNLFEDSPYLSRKQRKRDLDYIAKFYRIINDQARVKRKITDHCHQSLWLEKKAVEKKV